MSRSRKSIPLTLFLIPLLMPGAHIHAQETGIENMRYEDRFTFKHGKPYVIDPFVWTYTKEFAKRFHMPEAWIDPELEGALAVAFRMTTIGDMTCGWAGKAANCRPPLDRQMDIYYDSSIQLPWNYPQYVQDTLMEGLSSSRYLGLTPDSKSLKYASSNPQAPQGVMNGGSLVRENVGGWTSSIIYYDREYEPRVGLIGYRGKGVCPSYVGPDKIYMPFFASEDFRKFQNRQMPVQDMRIVHRIIFPKFFLRRANANHFERNKIYEQFMDKFPPPPPAPNQPPPMQRGFTQPQPTIAPTKIDLPAPFPITVF